MAKDYPQLWKAVTSANDEGRAARTLAEILLGRGGMAFISSLERDDAELCIEILDRVSRGSYLLPAFAVSDGSLRVSRGTDSKP